MDSDLMSTLQRLDRFLGVGMFREEDDAITEFAQKYRIGIVGLLDDNGITHAKFQQFLLRVIMTADALKKYLPNHPLDVGVPVRQIIPKNVVGMAVGNAIISSDLDKNQRFYAQYTDFSDQQNAFWGALRDIDWRSASFKKLLLDRIQEFRIDADQLRRHLRGSAARDAIYTRI